MNLDLVMFLRRVILVCMRETITTKGNNMKYLTTAELFESDETSTRDQIGHVEDAYNWNDVMNSIDENNFDNGSDIYIDTMHHVEKYYIPLIKEFLNNPQITIDDIGYFEVMAPDWMVDDYFQDDLDEAYGNLNN